MKKLRLLLMLFLGIFIFFGCKEEWSEPDFDIKDWEGPEHLNRYYTIGQNSAFPMFSVLGKHTPGNPPTPIVEPGIRNEIRYLRAVVVSSDEGGNYYKSMVIQDSTGGVELQLDMTGLYNFYPVGQKVVIVLNEKRGVDTRPILMVGDYNDLPQVGWIYNETQVGRINSLYFDQYIIRDGKPSLSNLPKPLTKDEIFPSSPNHVNKLVRLEGVTFEPKAIREPLAYDHIPTDWRAYIYLANGRKDSVTVRTSNFARFRNMIIEDKEYTLTGILTMYRGNYQFMIRTREDIETYVPQPDESVVFDFTSNPIGEGKWSIYPVSGATRWGFRGGSMMHFGNTEIGFQTAMDDWFISPEITYPDMENGYLRFEHQLPVSNAEYEAYQIYYTTSNATDFNINDWKRLGTLTSFPNSFGWSNPISISNIGANSFRIAFRYNAPNPDVKTFDWRIRRVEIRNK